MTPNNKDIHAIHTPLVIYAPKLIRAEKITYPVNEVDVSATIAALTNDNFINSSFGRNLLEKDFENKPHYSYFMTHEVNPTINVIGEEYVLKVRADGSDIRLFKYDEFKNNLAKNYASEYPELTKEMTDLARGLYEATRYTRFNNSTNRVNKKIEELYK